jgi:hypothetical protein
VLEIQRRQLIGNNACPVQQTPGRISYVFSTLERRHRPWQSNTFNPENGTAAPSSITVLSACPASSPTTPPPI